MKMPQCTWENCIQQATHPQNDNLGYEWANLCDFHNQVMTYAVESMRPQILLKVWMLAMGGSNKATKRMTWGKAYDSY